jgi:hypothetical protein
MGHRRFEIFHHKQIIESFGVGETEHEISRCRFMGPQKISEIRVLAKALCWPDTTQPLRARPTSCKSPLPIAKIQSTRPVCQTRKASQ